MAEVGIQSTLQEGVRAVNRLADLIAGTPTIVAGNIYSGSGSPAGVVSAPVGSLYLRSDGGAGTTLYVKESGTGTSGWVGK